MLGSEDLEATEAVGRGKAGRHHLSTKTETCHQGRGHYKRADATVFNIS